MLAVERPVVAVNRPSRRTEIFAQVWAAPTTTRDFTHWVY